MPRLHLQRSELCLVQAYAHAQQIELFLLQGSQCEVAAAHSCGQLRGEAFLPGRELQLFPLQLTACLRSHPAKAPS